MLACYITEGREVRDSGVYHNHATNMQTPGPRHRLTPSSSPERSQGACYTEKRSGKQAAIVSLEIISPPGITEP